MSRIRSIAVLGFVLPLSLAAQGKKRVAVMNFDYAPVHTSVNSIFGHDQDVGKGIADLLVNKLVQDGTYSVIERKNLDKILTEQNFSNSDRADANSAAKLGRILGVDAIVIGTVTQFGQDEKKKDVGGGLFGAAAGRYGVGGVQRKEARAVVNISARMVNTDTAEIIAVANGHATSSKTGTSLLGGGGYVGAAGSAMDMTSQDFSNTIMGEAVTTSVNALAQQFEAKAAQLPAHKIEINGLVADVSSGQVILNIGSRAGLKVGDRLEIRRSAREVRDPATGKVIRRVEDKIGDAIVAEVDEQSAVARFTGAQTPKVGDSVRMPQ